MQVKQETPVAGEVQEFHSEKMGGVLSAVQEKAKAGAARRPALEKTISFLPERKKITKHVPMVPPHPPPNFRLIF
jgi:hypothetical protein